MSVPLTVYQVTQLSDKLMFYWRILHPIIASNYIHKTWLNPTLTEADNMINIQETFLYLPLMAMIMFS